MEEKIEQVGIPPEQEKQKVSRKFPKLKVFSFKTLTILSFVFLLVLAVFPLLQKKERCLVETPEEGSAVACTVSSKGSICSSIELPSEGTSPSEESRSPVAKVADPEPAEPVDPRGPSSLDWKTYSSSSLGLEFRYPPDFTVEKKDNVIAIRSPRYSCLTYIPGDSVGTYVELSALRIDMSLHEGKTFEELWEEVFDFDYLRGNDGVITVDGKYAPYFVAGAEMPFGKQAYMVDLEKSRALLIDTYVPSYYFTCEDEQEEETFNGRHRAGVSRILSTIHFTD
jgi:hypothetical protein